MPCGTDRRRRLVCSSDLWKEIILTRYARPTAFTDVIVLVTVFKSVKESCERKIL